MEIHPAASIFPEMDDAMYKELKANIKSRGLFETIKLYDGKILDGRHRYRACIELGIKPRTETIDVDDPVEYVLSLNLHRRQLTASQRSMVGARARKWYVDEAKKKMSEGGKAGGRGRPKQGEKNFSHPNSRAPQARENTGKVVGVSGVSIDHATKVLAKAVPEVVQAVDEGRMAVSTAAVLASEPEEVQRQEAVNSKRGRKYKSGPNGAEPIKTKPEANGEKPEGQPRGVGVNRANEAIDCLKRIPKNDGLRKRGFQIVTDWIRHNK